MASVSIGASAQLQTPVLPGQSAEFSVLAATADSLGSKGKIVLSNGKEITALNLRQLCATPAADRQKKLAELTGDSKITLPQFARACDAMVSQTKRQGVSLHAPIHVSTDSLEKGGASGFVIEIGDAPKPAPPPPTEKAAAPPEPTPSGAQLLHDTCAKRFEKVVKTLPDDPFDESIEGFKNGPANEWLGGATMTAALGKLSRPEVKQLMGDAVAQRYAALSPDKRAELTGWLMARLDDQSEWSATFRMRDSVVAAFHDTATSFAHLANGPDDALLAKLTLIKDLEKSSKPEESALGHEMRFGLGLDKMSFDDLAAVKATIRNRASAVAAEEKRFAALGPTKLKEEVSGLETAMHDYVLANGAKPDSYLAERVQAAVATGKSEKKAMDRMALGTALAAGVAVGVLSGGAGTPVVVGWLSGMGTSAVTSIPGVIAAHNAIDRTSAAEATGLVAAGSTADAKKSALTNDVLTVAGIVIPGPLSTGLGKVFAKCAPATAQNATATLQALAIGGLALAVGDDSVSGMDEAMKKNATVATTFLKQLTAKDRDTYLSLFDASMNKAKATGDAQGRAKLLSLFFLERGGGLKNWSADVAAKQFDTWLSARQSARA